jgi:hypothetical protein
MVMANGIGHVSGRYHGHDHVGPFKRNGLNMPTWSGQQAVTMTTTMATTTLATGLDHDRGGGDRGHDHAHDDDDKR